MPDNDRPTAPDAPASAAVPARPSRRDPTQRPAGLRVLLTRPRAASDRFAADLCAALGPLPVTVAPLMETVPRGPLPDLDGIAGLIFTSAAGVEVFAAQTARRDATAWCVGGRTAAAAAAAGFADVRTAAGDAEALTALIAAAAPEGRLLHLHGTHKAGALAETLLAAGHAVSEAVIYDQTAQAPGPGFAAALAGPGPCIVPLFSPRSARLFAAAVESVESGDIGAPIWAAALSPAVAAALPVGCAARVAVAARPDADAMIQAIGDGFLA
jgi:uroporphyrinogen-III synthase